MRPTEPTDGHLDLTHQGSLNTSSEVVVPLSEEELRLLEQMERALAEEDPKFASTLQGSTIERAVKMRAIAAGAVFVAGMAMLLGGAVAQQIWLGVLGFIVMFGSAVIGLTAWRGRTAQHQPHDFDHQVMDPFEQRFRLVEGGKRDRSKGRRPKQAKSSRPRAQGKAHGSFMERMEQRWQQRRDRGGR